MKKLCFIALVSILPLTQVFSAVATICTSGLVQEVRLISSLKQPAEREKVFFSFQSRGFVSQSKRWDLDYGSLYVGDDYDWFAVSMRRDTRSVIKDLGAHDWTDRFEVPVVRPFPKLKEGENRSIFVDSSGADGAPGAQGRKAEPATNGGERQIIRPIEEVVWPEKAKPKAPAYREPKVHPAYVKAVNGHVYVMHIVDKARDYYVLFRIEALERGESCTISWRFIATPKPEPTGNPDE